MIGRRRRKKRTQENLAIESLRETLIAKNENEQNQSSPTVIVNVNRGTVQEVYEVGRQTGMIKVNA